MLRFTCGAREIGIDIKKFQNIMNMIVDNKYLQNAYCPISHEVKGVRQ